ncbi:MAG: response regulator [Treponema sp.]|nr:response regulator [Treponema sp.]
MDEKAYNSYFFLRKKEFRITIPLTALICFILLLLIEHLYPETYSQFRGLISHQNRCYTQVIPIMILTSLSGYLSGALVVLAYFGIECMIQHTMAYHAFVLLIASLIANFPVNHGTYKSIWRTAVFVLISALILGNGWQFLTVILEGKTVFVESEIFHFLTALPACAFVGAFFYIYYNFFPDSIKDWFFSSTFESKNLNSIRQAIEKRKGQKISVKITRMIVSEALVLIFAGFGFANGLLSEFNIFDAWGGVVFATRLTILMAIVGVPIVLFCFTFANLNITHPIALMAKAVEDSNFCNITEHTRDVPRLDIKELKINLKDEIGVLYDSLVDMLSTTQNYIKNLERSQLLETQLATAKAASKAKTDFLSNMSHEIRTPINAVLGLNEMIIRESKDAEITKYAKDVENAGKSLLSIVNDILDFSKIEAGKLEIIPTNYDLSSAINDLINMISKRANDKHLAFNVEVAPDTPHLLFGDDVRLKQCCLNILTNAVKYTNEGSVALKISGKKTDYSHVMLTIHVVDTGIGIKDKDIPKLFTAFQRVEEKRNRTIEGTGLGLNIVQSLLSLMNSRLEVVSMYGAGSDFYFSVLQGVIDWEPIGDFRETYKKSLENATAYHELFKAPNAKILVVDDTELNLTVVKGLLKQTEIQIDTVISGYDALEALQKTHYDIVFLDHRMPGMDGIQTFEKMLTLENNMSKGVPVIALTANAVAGAKEMYLSKGFSDYMTKPIEGEKLEDLILRYLPENLVQKYQAEKDDEEEIAMLDENGEVQDSGSAVKDEKILQITGINLEDALKYTGGEEVLCPTLKEFYRVIDKNSAEIEQFAADKDWRNYTILVHALKSSARLIGAEKLSEDAKYLEKCGDEENEAEITAKTPALLELYRSYKENLAPLCANDCDEDEGKEEMPVAQYEEAVSNIGECISAFDYDTADQIIAMMKDFKIPAEKKQHFDDLVDAVNSVDQERILNLTKSEG